MSISLVTIGSVDGGVLDAVEEALGRTFSLAVERGGALPEPVYAFDSARNQFSAPAILREIIRCAPRGARRVLGVTQSDLFIPMLSFLFGQAQLDGLAALISSARLRQTFYGLPDDHALTIRRSAIEAIHETGHTFGLIHCMNRSCPMSLATNIHQLDMKGDTLCGGCSLLLGDSSSLKTIKAHA